jgi:hypothetical protein
VWLTSSLQICLLLLHFQIFPVVDETLSVVLNTIFEIYAFLFSDAKWNLDYLSELPFKIKTKSREQKVSVLLVEYRTDGSLIPSGI